MTTLLPRPARESWRGGQLPAIAMVTTVPLSRLVELEILELGVHGRIRLWRSLRHLGVDTSGTGDLDVEELLSRGEKQLERIEAHRVRAATEALT